MVSSAAPHCYNPCSLLHLYSTHQHSILQRRSFTEKRRSSCSPGAEVTCGARQDALLQPYGRAVLRAHQLHDFLCWAQEILFAVTSAVSAQLETAVRHPHTDKPGSLNILHSWGKGAIKKKEKHLLHTLGSLTAGGKMNSMLKWPSIRMWISPIASLSSTYTGFWTEQTAALWRGSNRMKRGLQMSQHLFAKEQGQGSIPLAEDMDLHTWALQWNSAKMETSGLTHTWADLAQPAREQLI